MRRMKGDKAVGTDSIPVEAWKSLEKLAVAWPTRLFNKLLEEEKMPEERRKSLLGVMCRAAATTKRYCFENVDGEVQRRSEGVALRVCGPREGLGHFMRKSGMAEKYVKEAKKMFDERETAVGCAEGKKTGGFKVESMETIDEETGGRVGGRELKIMCQGNDFMLPEMVL
nr:uncharacterized protein LOC113807245 [Penaeus vannamei]